MAKPKKSELLQNCPCASGIVFENCCQPKLLGLEKAKTAEELMRARYSAFATGNIDFIMQTHHPEKVKEIDRQAIKDWSEKSQWLGLEMVRTEKGTAKDDEGIVEFIANYIQEGKTYNHHEISLFKKIDDNWYFFDIYKNRPIKKDNKVGRNDPCHCGSGVKFKKCHGKAA